MNEHPASSDRPLEGRPVLVTGATGGLGGRVARLLGEAGAPLTLVARDQRRLDDLTGVEGARRAVDLTTPEGPAEAVRAALEAHGSLAGVVHAAGVVAFGPVTDVDDDTVDELFLLNALAPLRLLRAAAPALRESAGAHGDAFLVTFSGVVAEHPQKGMAAYSASKAASWALAAAAGDELRRDRVRVLDVRPPHTETGLAEHPVAGEAPRLPAGKDPDDVAARVVRAVLDGDRDLPTSAF
ncbi:SDR family NAD(P)-dependent oxidoreductase [Aquipuribacter nitratireducens]|uniref:SDR family NAD(P)-dependent oxidoreductase n=1 Tax=Aquipuribacter nitratireducens TaxID=650104 RepID=A0ABW0GUM4_9MICO